MLLAFGLSACGGGQTAGSAPAGGAPEMTGWNDEALTAFEEAMNVVVRDAIDAAVRGDLPALLDQQTAARIATREARARHGEPPEEVRARVQELEDFFERRVLQVEADALERQARLAAATAPATRGDDAPVAQEERPPVQTTRPEDIVLRWPMETVNITSTYGPRVGVFASESHSVKFHDGVDLRASYGEPILASGPGTVTEAKLRGGYGLMVTIDHGLGIETQYAHLAQIEVLAGQAVSAGDVIGYAGDSGRSTATHLHLMVRFRGRKVDPANVLGRRLGEFVEADAP
jgi:murein DD-endopeptidase MepM/ murein hydrolase activator NlpD